MKQNPLYALLLLLFATASYGQTQVATGYIANLYCVEDCYLTIQTGFDSPEMEDYILQFEADGKTLKINAEFKDLTQPSPNPDYPELNPKYQQKKVKVYYKLVNGNKTLEKLEHDSVATAKPSVVATPNVVTAPPRPDLTDSFPKATCKIFDRDGVLQGIVENGTYYKIRYTGTKSSGKTVQNKNEYCRGVECVRMTLNSQGYIVKYSLPNTTDGTIWGKVSGNKMWFCKKADGSDINDANYFTFTGDKQQAVNLICIYDWFR